MTKNALLISTVLIWFITGCGTMQSMVKSSFPYTTTLTIPASTQVGENHSAMGPASSFDQNFFKSANHINAVKIISAELRSVTPADFDLGNIKSVKIYLSKGDDSNGILVASQNNIPIDAGNTITLTVDNTNFLDRFVREPDVKIKMLYQLRKEVPVETSLMIALNISAYPVGNK
jgi:hypothetical protein